jgi:uncharacterized protein (DUF433 family)
MTDEQALIDRGIERDPHRPGTSEARLVGCGVSVWALVGALPMAGGDIAELAEAYEVPREAVEVALAYYRQHRATIDARLLLNAEPVTP